MKGQSNAQNSVTMQLDPQIFEGTMRKPCRPRRYRHTLSMLLITLVATIPVTAQAIPDFSAFQFIGDTSNYTNPGVWEAKQLSITPFVPGASDALLTFEVANDLPGSTSAAMNMPTNAHLYFASDAGEFFLNFEWFFVPASATAPAGNSSVHFRDVRLTIDGVLYRDQFVAFNNDLGDPFLGTASDGADDGSNILGQTGFEARTYVFATAVPEPSTFLLLSSGLIALLGYGLRRRRHEPHSRTLA